MNNMKRLTALTLAGVLSLSVLTGCTKQGAASSSSSPSSSAASSAQENYEIKVDISTIKDLSVYLCGLSGDTVVATAGDIKITAAELMYWIVTNCDQLSTYYLYYQGTSELPWDTVNEEEGKTFSEYVLQDTATYAALQGILTAKAKEAGVTVTKEEKDAIERDLESVATQLAADTDKINLEQYLWQQGLTGDLFRKNYESDYLYKGLSNYYFGPGGANEPSEEILRSYLKDSGYYKVKHILLATVDTGTRDPLDDTVKAEKKKQAEDVLAQLKKGGNDEALFDKLMKQYSEDPGLATNPNGYEFQVNTTVDPAFEDAALELEEGQISGVVDGASGYHIIMRLPLDNPRDHLEEFISEQMSLMAGMWLENMEVEMTDACKALDPRKIYQAMADYRETVAALVEE